MPVSRTYKPILVGEQNPYGGDPRFALYPAPVGCSGHRLCCLILGMRRAAYLGEFDRVNLCPGPWRVGEAATVAVGLLRRRVGRGRLILLGRKVCSAFDVPYVPFTVAPGGVMLRLPHPSGRCRAWSAEDAVDRARAAVSAFVPEVAHLLGVEGVLSTVDGEEEVPW